MTVITALVALGTVLQARLLWTSFADFVARMDNCDLAFCDFVRHYWRMGRTLLQTHEPSPGFLYSPFFALIMVPLGALAKSTAVAVWGVLQGSMLLALFALGLVRPSARQRWVYAAYAVAFAWSIPLYHDFKWGQISVLLTALTLAALELERRDRSRLAAVLLAFAAALKGYAALFVLVLAARRRGRALLVFAATSLVLLAVVPAAVLGVADTWRFYQTVSERLSAAQTGFATNPNSQSFASVVARWGVDFESMPPQPATSLRLLGYLLAAINLTFAWRWLRQPRGYASACALLWLSIPLLLQTSWPHYFVYLPAVIGTACVLLSCEDVSRGWRVGGGVWVLLFALLSLLPALQIAGRWYFYSRGGWLLVADLGLLAWFYADRILAPRRMPA
jgi:hypothetical protein